MRDVAEQVLSSGLQNWGQSVNDRVLAWQGAFDFMNLSVTLSAGKNFVFDGPDADRASMFMAEVKAKFPLGNFEAEQAMIEDCLRRYAKT